MATATKPKKQKSPTVMVTLSTFDQSERPVYRVVREGVKLKNFEPIGEDHYKPQGGTPLIDATYAFLTHMRKLAAKNEVQIGLLLDESYSMNPSRQAVIDSTNKFVDGLREVSTVDPDAAGTGFLVIATDGEENSSSEHTYEDLGKLVAKCEEDGWVLVFLGASIDGWAQGSALGLSQTARGSTISTVNSPSGHTSSIGYAGQSASAYLTSSSSYLRSAKGMGSVTEDGSLVDANIAAGAPPVYASKAAHAVYDSSEALKKAKSSLSE